MKMVSLKRTPADVAEERAETAMLDKLERPAYHYGLNLSLEAEELAKLGMLDNLPPVGTKFTLQVGVMVAAVRQQQMADGEPEACLTLQVQEMGIPDAQPQRRQIASLTSRY